MPISFLPCPSSFDKLRMSKRGRVLAYAIAFAKQIPTSNDPGNPDIGDCNNINIIKGELRLFKG